MPADYLLVVPTRSVMAVAKRDGVVVVNPSSTVCDVMSIRCDCIADREVTEIAADNTAQVLNGLKVLMFGVSHKNPNITEKNHHCAPNARIASKLTFSESTYKLRRDLRDDGVAVGAQLLHSSGNPIT